MPLVKPHRSLTPIPTRYAGHLFRSRLEARWAVFFDSFGVRWIYEYEGYQLRHGWYLPDFYLPTLSTWVEIKPAAPSDLEEIKCLDLAMATGKRVVLMSGEFGWWTDDNWPRRGDGQVWWPTEGSDNPYEPCFCPFCGEFGFEYSGYYTRACRRYCGGNDKARVGDHPRMIAAVNDALCRRFWNQPEVE